VALAKLGERLEAREPADAVLQGIVDTVMASLRVAYCAIETPERDGVRHSSAAEAGVDMGRAEVFPMIYQADIVGQLVVATAAGDVLTGEDRKLLQHLTRQAAVAVRAVDTATALQASRVSLVTAREEERRRLRRDLHDGLGPTLAGVTLGLHAAQTRLTGDPTGTQQLLADLEAQIEGAVADIRRLVYGLRPPALDEFGLLRAIERHAARLDESGGLVVTVEGPPEGLGALPAAVEVAAYRIATEALTNVARHSGASMCAVRIRRGARLEFEIADNGVGMDRSCMGVGTAAMRERAAELGGDVQIGRNGGAGTLVAGWFPVAAGT
jgi:signal transduction histidine kinase